METETPGTYSLRANARSTMPSSALLTAAPRDSAARRSRPHLCPERAPNPPPAACARARAAPGQWRPVRGEVPRRGRVKERLLSAHYHRRSPAEAEEVLCAAVFRSPSSAVGRWRLVVSGPIRSNWVPLERPVSQLHGGVWIAALGPRGGAHHRRTPTNLGTQIDVMGCWCSDYRRSPTSEPISVGPAPECSARTGLSGGVSRLKLGPLAPPLCPFVCAQARWKERSLRASISRLACENGANDWLLPLRRVRSCCHFCRCFCCWRTGLLLLCCAVLCCCGSGWRRGNGSCDVAIPLHWPVLSLLLLVSFQISSFAVWLQTKRNCQTVEIMEVISKQGSCCFGNKQALDA